MPLIALSDTTQLLWSVTLAVGAVVLVVVILLLTVLLRRVQAIDHGVREIYESAGPLAANTATTWQLEQTAVELERLAEEAGRHDEMLDRKL
jgi:hypothetical protein